MFYVIKNENLYEFGDSVNSAWDFPEEAQELKGVTLMEYSNEQDRYKISDGKLIDISDTDEYKAKKSIELAEKRKSEIQEELDLLDLKCIRAIREGGQDDDGVPFIEKYQAEIIALREEYNSL